MNICTKTFKKFPSDFQLKAIVLESVYLLGMSHIYFWKVYIDFFVTYIWQLSEYKNKHYYFPSK